MYVKVVSYACSFVVISCLAFFSPVLVAQNSIQLFGPVDVRLSATGTGFGSDEAIFNSTTLNLTCSASPITAVLSSSADGTGNLIVDNNINLTVTAGGSTTGPTNICVGGVNGSPAGPLQNCFTQGFQASGSSGSLAGQDPDNYVATGGVPPIDISQSLVSGPVQAKIDLVDQGSGPGFYLSNSTLYLDTNCTQGGVTGPALVSGNPIPQNNPTPAQLSQDFSFNPIVNQQIGFTYDLTEALAANSLTINDGTIPQVGDSPLAPAIFQSVYVPQTSFATSSCLVHSGELLSNGQPACKLFTLECKVGTGSTATGAQCPISMQNNELFQDSFDGPAFTLSDIVTPNGPTFHEGVGFLMANEGWTGGACTFDPAADLQDLPCPQNLLSSFSSGIEDAANVRKTNARAALAGTSKGLEASQATAQLSVTPLVAAAVASTSSYASSGRTTHPNSTFITVTQVPEDLTTVTVAGLKAGNWINNPTPSVTLSSQPPNLTGTNLPGAANFVASLIQSITYGVAPVASVPIPGALDPNASVLSSGVVCPTQANPTGQAASTFTPGAQTLNSLADGHYLLYYYAQDCAGTEELKFTQNGGNWSTSFYTYPINVDTAPPVVASGPTLSPAGGTYEIGQIVTASYSCTDTLSGVTRCGTKTFASGTSSTGKLISTVDTSSAGAKTFTVQAVDAAGNQSSTSVNYTVGAARVNLVVSCRSAALSYGQDYICGVYPSSNVGVPPGVITYTYDNSSPKTIPVVSGVAGFTIPKPAIGQHTIVVSYAAQSTYAAAGPVTENFTVSLAPVVVRLTPSTTFFTGGTDLWLTASVQSSSAGSPDSTGSFTFLDGNKVLTVMPADATGKATLVIPVAQLTNGTHSYTAKYAGGANYATGSASISVTVAKH
jgi:hypothetical protein